MTEYEVNDFGDWEEYYRDKISNNTAFWEALERVTIEYSPLENVTEHIEKIKPKLLARLADKSVYVERGAGDSANKQLLIRDLEKYVRDLDKINSALKGNDRVANHIIDGIDEHLNIPFSETDGIDERNAVIQNTEVLQSSIQCALDKLNNTKSIRSKSQSVNKDIKFYLVSLAVRYMQCMDIKVVKRAESALDDISKLFFNVCGLDVSENSSLHRLYASVINEIKK